MENPSHVILWARDQVSWEPILTAWRSAGFAIEVLDPDVSPSEVAQRAGVGPSVAVVDLSADFLRGIEVVSACRRIAPNAPIVVVASDLSVDVVRTIRSSGVFYVALAPPDPTEMREVVLNALASAGRERPVPAMVRTPDRVLVVDDDADFIAAVTTLLESEGYAVSVARSGREALQVLASERPDLIVLDIMMEDAWAGYAVNQALKWGEHFEWARSIPILMVSSIPMDPATRFQGAGEVGMVTPDAYMTKPLDSARFLAVARDLIHAHRPRRT